jgi:hypothetical protein
LPKNDDPAAVQLEVGLNLESAFLDVRHVTPNGWWLSGEGGEADRVRCSRGFK